MCRQSFLVIRKCIRDRNLSNPVDCLLLENTWLPRMRVFARMLMSLQKVQPQLAHWVSHLGIVFVRAANMITPVCAQRFLIMECVRLVLFAFDRAGKQAVVGLAQLLALTRDP